MNAKLLGGILLIVGTTIGGGMLALPVVTAQGGFVGSVFLLIASWIVMTFAAFLILEVNMWYPPNSNLIMMVKKTLGNTGAIIAWLCYLILFYCLLAAYIAGGSDILRGLVNTTKISTSATLDAILFTLLLAVIVYRGIKSIDHVNRWLMLIKLGAFLFLVSLIIPHIDISRYDIVHVKYLVPAVTVVITSFGFSTIIPTLRVYFHNDVAVLRKVIIIGSAIPLICYIIWVAVILGGIPFEGPYGMRSIFTSDHSTLALTQALIHHSNNASVTSFTHIFTSVCMVTSFLGVAICLVDFLADGLKVEKIGLWKLLLHVITFLPPLMIAIFYPSAFILGLSYAGVCIAILIIIFPALMTWNGRYIKNIAADYRVAGGKLPLIGIILVAIFVIYQGLFLH